MRIFIAFVFISAFLFQSLTKSVILVNYKLNKAAITNAYCENKAKPMMHCNGQCHLRKQLQKEEKKENSFPVSLKDKTDIQLYSESETFFSYENNIRVQSYLIGNTCCTYRKHLLAVFHPPQV